MENIISNISICIFVLIEAVIVVGIVFKVFRCKLSKEKTLEGIVIDKQSYDKRVYGKNRAPFSKKEYVITFLCGKRKLYFDVSELSYKNYRLNQKGELTYRGNKLIDFK